MGRLFITLRPMEFFMIGADIKVSLRKKDGKNVTMMIEAPIEIDVKRGPKITKEDRDAIEQKPL